MSTQGPVYAYRISDYPQLREIWSLVCELSFIPDDFDLGAYQAHIGQPSLRRAREEIDALPTAERIAQEYADCERDLRHPKVRNGPLSRLQERNGVVKLGPGMDRERRFRLTDSLSDFFGGSVLESGNYLYPPGGFKEWHTNMASVPGWRLYIVRKPAGGQSFFRYVDNASMRMETLWDEDGVLNIFEVRRDQPFWHAVCSIDAYRWSKGFVIPGTWRNQLLG